MLCLRLQRVLVITLNDLFSKYIDGWMFEDIQRELDLVRKGKKAGNVICALALLSYTEFMGSLIPNTGKRKPKENFDLFLSRMGEEYNKVLSLINVYDIFRCGLSHEYFVKGACTIVMLNSSSGQIKVKGQLENNGQLPSSLIKKPHKCGIGKAKNGSYYFIVEKYFEDFKGACKSLEKELDQKPEIPYTYLLHPVSTSG
jgi:hypothetical protein